MTIRQQQAQQFLAKTGWQAARRHPVVGDASRRSYQRLQRDNGETAILMDAPPDSGEDVTPFIAIAEYLLAQGFSAPRILAADREQGFLLLEDLGDALFARLMAEQPERQTELYRCAIDVLQALDQCPLPELPHCDADWLTGMTAPVFDFYAREAEASKDAFREVFHPLAQRLDDTDKILILRDYHAENLLLQHGREGAAKVGLLDFQDALIGHPAYDLVSILQDARRDVPAALETEMIAYFLEGSRRDYDGFHAAYALLGAQRNLRILGIFARLCQQDGKPQYIDLIPRVWTYLQRNLTHPALANLAAFLAPLLPEPTGPYLEQLKNQCATIRKP
ncbi:aminoglycoside phosphotransferase family protein [Sulfitobacter aestuarii]|uniref:Aminoglycoside phosphotransferase family protein n=1 Tax=Sulfitobacter aestuarii TaxID=2161676 RepID=A0ABW5U5W6_9RHOB